VRHAGRFVATKDCAFATLAAAKTVASRPWRGCAESLLEGGSEGRGCAGAQWSPIALDMLRQMAKPEAGAALLASVGGLDLLEAIEDAVELSWDSAAFRRRP